jgi:hypothetical protein
LLSEPKRDLPEWIRVIAIFVLTFALFAVLAGLAGAKVERTEDPSLLTAEGLNRP